MDASPQRTVRPQGSSDRQAGGSPGSGQAPTREGESEGRVEEIANGASVDAQIRRFRWAAIAEAWSWAGLLVAMVFKYLVIQNPIGVQIMGPIHGLLFVLYVLFALQLAGSLRWSTTTVAVAIAAAFPPFCTVWFERWALRAGLFAERDPG